MDGEGVDKQLGGCTGKGFVPGQSGNPKGRPKKEHTLTSCVQELLDKQPDKVTKDWRKKGMTGAQMAAVAIVQKVTKGDAAVLKEVWQRTEGKVPQPLEHSGPDGQPIDIRQLTTKELLEIAAGKE